MTVTDLETHLRARRDEGRKLLVPYVTGGLGDGWTEVVEAVVAAGADAVEIGIPFSDPVMDGPTIQEASQRALLAGATPTGIISSLGDLKLGVPLVVMTYYNIVFRTGHRRFARLLADNGVSGAVVPDVPLEELHDWSRAADDAGIATVLLAAPITPEARLAADLRTLPRLRVRRERHGRNGGAARDRELGLDPRQAAEGDHRQAGVDRLRGVNARARG